MENKQKLTVYVSDFSDYVPGRPIEDSLWTDGEYDDYEKAVARCRQIIDDGLRGKNYETWTAEKFKEFRCYYPDPWISPDPAGTPFATEEYLEEIRKRHNK
jgi:hypothetical protein